MRTVTTGISEKTILYVFGPKFICIQSQTHTVRRKQNHVSGMGPLYLFVSTIISQIGASLFAKGPQTTKLKKSSKICWRYTVTLLQTFWKDIVYELRTFRKLHQLQASHVQTKCPMVSKTCSVINVITFWIYSYQRTHYFTVLSEPGKLLFVKFFTVFGFTCMTFVWISVAIFFNPF